jgi:hypothetical protein
MAALPHLRHPASMFATLPALAAQALIDAEGLRY